MRAGRKGWHDLGILPGTGEAGGVQVLEAAIEAHATASEQSLNGPLSRRTINRH